MHISHFLSTAIYTNTYIYIYIYIYTANHLLEGANLPQYPMGRLNTDHTEMTSRTATVTSVTALPIAAGLTSDGTVWLEVKVHATQRP